jgi:hypothetical protein
MVVYCAGFPAIYGRQPLYFQDPTFAARAAVTTLSRAITGTGTGSSFGQVYPNVRSSPGSHRPVNCLESAIQVVNATLTGVSFMPIFSGMFEHIRPILQGELVSHDLVDLDFAVSR